MHVAPGHPRLYGPIWARPGPRGPGVPLMLYMVDVCLSKVDVGPSHAAVKLLSLVTAMSCASVLHVTRQCSRRDVDGDYKTVVARGRGWQSLVVVLRCARFFVGRGGEKSLSARPTLRRCRLRVHHSFLKDVAGSLCLLYSECREKP
jgi:hypothetical protein